MNAIVFGGTGFIGGHVAEQLHIAGHEVTVAARESSNTTFLDELGVAVVRVNFSDQTEIVRAIQGNHVVYNCTADANLGANIAMDAAVEVQLTKSLVEAAAKAGANRFVQLSTIVVYDFKSSAPMDELYPSIPEYPIQSLALERERVVKEAGQIFGIETIILRPASTIGVRDKKSFFARLFAAHSQDQFPLVGDGTAKVSLVDTRDIGRAMEFLGSVKKFGDDDGIYVLKGFDTTWAELKAEMDHAACRAAGLLQIPFDITAEQLAQYRLNEFSLMTFVTNRLWDDGKIRALGFSPRYSLREAVETEVRDLVVQAVR